MKKIVESNWTYLISFGLVLAFLYWAMVTS